MASSLKAFFPLLGFVLLVLSFSEAREFLVDGKKNSWKIPSSSDEFNKWAEKNRFQIGDSLVLEYDAKVDSVLEVNGEDYKSCNKAKPTKSFNDGNTKIVLDRPGPFYFISGAEGHCEKGQKLEVEVLSCKHGSKCKPPAPSPSPSPSPKLKAPAPAPANGGHGLTRAAGSMDGIVFLMFASLVGLFLV